MSLQYRFVEVVDTVSIRGNRLFGDAGSYGDTSYPPRPSVISGAFRSVLWTKNGGDVNAIKASSFSIHSMFLARRQTGGEVEVFLPLPADVLVTQEGEKIRRLKPVTLTGKIKHSQLDQLPMIPVLQQSTPAKPEMDWVLNQSGVETYLQGENLDRSHLEERKTLWRKEARVGIGLKHHSRTVEEGMLFTVEHTAPRHSDIDLKENSTGLLVGISGADDKLPESGFLRLGGDGKAAHYKKTDIPSAISAYQFSDSFKVVMQTPGLFQAGWLPDGVEEQEGEYWLKLDGFKARLVCASISRYEVISGWDLDKWCPKDAERVVPTGSVYWFDQAQGDVAALNKFIADGWWLEKLKENESIKSRWAEGYNRILLAAW